METKARTLVVDIVNKEVREVYCGNLDDFYREINCDTIDIARRSIGGIAYDIFVDDIGLWHDDYQISAVNPWGLPMLVGNLVIANHDGMGNTTSLSDEDIERIKKNIRHDGVLVCEYLI